MPCEPGARSENLPTGAATRLLFGALLPPAVQQAGRGEEPVPVAPQHALHVGRRVGAVVRREIRALQRWSSGVCGPIVAERSLAQQLVAHVRLFSLWRTLSVRILTDECGSSTGSPHVCLSLQTAFSKEKINARGLGVTGPRAGGGGPDGPIHGRTESPVCFYLSPGIQSQDTSSYKTTTLQSRVVC